MLTFVNFMLQRTFKDSDQNTLSKFQGVVILIIGYNSNPYGVVVEDII